MSRDFMLPSHQMPHNRNLPTIDKKKSLTFHIYKEPKYKTIS